MHVAEQIDAALRAHFTPTDLRVTDDSAKHAGHAGARPEGNTHFTVNIVSDAFVGMNRVARHRAVYDVMKPFFEGGLHALAIHARTPGE